LIFFQWYKINFFEKNKLPYLIRQLDNKVILENNLFFILLFLILTYTLVLTHFINFYLYGIIDNEGKLGSYKKSNHI